MKITIGFTQVVANILLLTIISLCCNGVDAQNVSGRSKSFGFLDRSVHKSERHREKARELVKEAMNAMGGEEKLRALKTLTIEGIGHDFAVEQSERPEGPYVVAYQQVTEIRDVAGSAIRRTIEARQIQAPKWFGVNMILSDGISVFEREGRFIPRRISDARDLEIELALSPEKLFVTASAAADLTFERETHMDGVPHSVLSFTWKGDQVRIFLNKATKLPTAVETTTASPGNIFWSIWGDYSTMSVYSLWTLEKGGLRFPRQRDVSRNGYPIQSYTITDLKINEQLDPTRFEIPENVRKQFQSSSANLDELPLGDPKKPIAEFAPGVIYIPGSWGVTLVKQNDGIVVVEAPISSGYSAKVLGEIKRRFPGLPVKAVVTTSDAFPHIGGVREYVSKGVPLYALDLNISLLKRVVLSPRRMFPDDQEKVKRSANFAVVAKKTIVGHGPTRFEIYPIRTETGERMMMVYFPEHRLLYASDLVQKMPNGSFFAPQYLSEIVQAVEREKLIVETVYAMHNDRTPWSEVLTAVANQSAGTDAVRDRLELLVKQILDADYRADQNALEKLYRELEPFIEHKEFGAKVRYWRGFAQWRRGINGLNDAVDPKELEKDFKLAIAEFESAISKDPSFVDAKLAAGASMGLLSYLYGFTPAFAAELSKDPGRVREIVSKALKYVNEAEAAQPENPRVLWVLGQIRWTLPPEMGGGQMKAIETNERGLKLAMEGKGDSNDPLMPSWGRPELMMNLAINHQRRKDPDLVAAERYARSALERIPNWHYVKDILLPQILAKKEKTKEL